jgi:hypothetical protein
MSQEVNAVSVATPVYLRWFESPITFDRMDHPDFIPKQGRFSLIVDPLIGMTRLTKAFMDGGSWDLLTTSPHPFNGVVLGKHSIILPITFRDASNYRTKTLTFKVVNLMETREAPTPIFWWRRRITQLGKRIDVHGLTTTIQGRYTLVTNTPTPVVDVILWSMTTQP